MQWKTLARRLVDMIEKRGALADETAMVQINGILYELDLYRSLGTGRLHIGLRFPGVDAMPEHIEDATEASLQPEDEIHGPLEPKSDWLEKVGKGKE